MPSIRPAGARPKAAPALAPAKPVLAPLPKPAVTPQRPAPAAVAASEPVRAPYRRVVAFALVIAAVAAGLFCLVRWMNPPSARTVASSVAVMPSALADAPAFASWVAGWKALDPYLSRTEFTSTGTSAFSLSSPVALTPDDLRAPRSRRYAWTADQSHFVDFLRQYPDDPASAWVYGRNGTDLSAVRGACAPGCVIEDAFWTDDQHFALLVRMPAVKPDGSALCISDGDAPRCYERLAVRWFDLGASRVTEYESAPHVFAVHPTDAQRKNRWALGLSPEEQVNFGAVPGQAMAFVNGVISDSSPDGTSFAVDQGQFGKMVIKIVAGTRIRDAAGDPVQFTYLHDGFTVAASGPQESASLIVADKIDVKTAPGIVLSAPADGAAVGRTFGVLGSAVDGAWPLDVSVTDARGKTLVSARHARPAAGQAAAAYADFALEVTLPKAGLAAGDALHLVVKAKTGDMAARDLTYRP